MPHTRAAWLRAAAPVAVLALALTACGGKKDAPTPTAGSGGSGSSAASGVNARDSSDAAPETGKGPTAPAGAGALKPGQSGTGQYKEESGKVTYEVAAQKVRVGTEAEARKMVQDPKDATGLVAATVYVKYTNKGPAVVKGLARVDNGAEIYADGQRGGLLIGAPEDLPGCEDSIDIDNWAVGQSHVICQTYMIPKGARSLEVHWGDDGAPNPLIWKFDNTG
ncbi:hypothetical protein ADL22_27190 [Streptomyces sp. NRRL F-4489]|uniref:hypothetical protein n=1 Tax=Streptomyces sp. NRRL F-4489 TaxID=1609095 RepID=UPI00074A4D35|nr:hypothetical protein [Streptomyces sp. NRRL F-4489]KUL35520.1 hypothetical protein ADL22_27190 [Streptomyces sp. NRRL F-4489]